MSTELIPRKETTLPDTLDPLDDLWRDASRVRRQHVDPTKVLDGAEVAELLHERVVRICFLLVQGPMRYNQLLRALEPISTRTLSVKLALLQVKGLVERTHHDETPPRVEYSLTHQGRRYVDLLFPALLLLQDQ